jgi:hypothetical protein
VKGHERNTLSCDLYLNCNRKMPSYGVTVSVLHSRGAGAGSHSPYWRSLTLISYGGALKKCDICYGVEIRYFSLTGK